MSDRRVAECTALRAMSRMSSCSNKLVNSDTRLHKKTKISSSYNAHTHSPNTMAVSPCLFVLLGASTSSHTPGCPEAEHDGENAAVATQRRHTGYLNPSFLDPAPLKMRDREETLREWASCQVFFK